MACVRANVADQMHSSHLHHYFPKRRLRCSSATFGSSVFQQGSVAVTTKVMGLRSQQNTSGVQFASVFILCFVDPIPQFDFPPIADGLFVEQIRKWYSFSTDFC